MRPVVEDMARADPAKCPTIDRVVACFADIQKGLSVWKLRAHVLGEREHPYLPPSNCGALVSPDSGHFNAGLRGAGSFVLDYHGSHSEPEGGRLKLGWNSKRCTYARTWNHPGINLWTHDDFPPTQRPSLVHI
ncbi:hypothetical protein DFH08DRAFT_907752 [Mycena albidolilacea]|uniref:Uncharacterized protein n=1 Tax=Mycena albidolilacea TaxID=1033008 RepID=A0AAD7E6Q8_9AGAR|nr:hypothetical protein DFH08DRAFT_907752 [Mycena albidolilacea]